MIKRLQKCAVVGMIIITASACSLVYGQERNALDAFDTSIQKRLILGNQSALNNIDLENMGIPAGQERDSLQTDLEELKNIANNALAYLNALDNVKAKMHSDPEGLVKQYGGTPIRGSDGSLRVSSKNKTQKFWEWVNPEALVDSYYSSFKDMYAEKKTAFDQKVAAAKGPTVQHSDFDVDENYKNYEAFLNSLNEIDLIKDGVLQEDISAVSSAIGKLYSAAQKILDALDEAKDNIKNTDAYNSAITKAQTLMEDFKRVYDTEAETVQDAQNRAEEFKSRGKKKK